MSTTFVALPVSKGDSFLLKVDHLNYLVDGGDDEDQSHDLLINNEKVNALDALICTHNDKDHANGVIGILKDSQMPVKEVWVPAVWLQLAATITASGDDWIRRLADDLKSLDGEKSFDDLINEGRNGLTTSALGTIPKEVVLASLAGSTTNWLQQLNSYAATGTPLFPTLNSKLATSAAGDATRILAIVQLAAKRKLRLRHFEFQNQVTNVPVGQTDFWSWNALERTRIRRGGSVFDLLALSVANRNSLVFEYRMRSDPSVLFCADSNFDFMPTSHQKILPSESLASAPHHGSGANTRPYQLVGNEVENWVRSDELSKHRPCKDYINLSSKYCTICRTPQSSHRPVRFELVSHRWQTKSPLCTCK